MPTAEPTRHFSGWRLALIWVVLGGLLTYAVVSAVIDRRRTDVTVVLHSQYRGSLMECSNGAGYDIGDAFKRLYGGDVTLTTNGEQLATKTITNDLDIANSRKFEYCDATVRFRDVKRARLYGVRLELQDGQKLSRLFNDPRADNPTFDWYIDGPLPPWTSKLSGVARRVCNEIFDRTVAQGERSDDSLEAGYDGLRATAGLPLPPGNEVMFDRKVGPNDVAPQAHALAERLSFPDLGPGEIGDLGSIGPELNRVVRALRTVSSTESADDQTQQLRRSLTAWNGLRVGCGWGKYLDE